MTDIPDRWKLHVGRNLQIRDFIKELQETEKRFGNTRIYLTGCVWGAVALNHYDQDRKLFIERHPDVCPACLGRGEGSAGDCPCEECQAAPGKRDLSINPLQPVT